MQVVIRRTTITKFLKCSSLKRLPAFNSIQREIFKIINHIYVSHHDIAPYIREHFFDLKYIRDASYADIFNNTDLDYYAKYIAMQHLLLNIHTQQDFIVKTLDIIHNVFLIKAIRNFAYFFYLSPDYFDIASYNAFVQAITSNLYFDTNFTNLKKNYFVDMNEPNEDFYKEGRCYWEHMLNFGFSRNDGYGILLILKNVLKLHFDMKGNDPKATGLIKQLRNFYRGFLFAFSLLMSFSYVKNFVLIEQLIILYELTKGKNHKLIDKFDENMKLMTGDCWIIELIDPKSVVLVKQASFDAKPVKNSNIKEEVFDDAQLKRQCRRICIDNRRKSLIQEHDTVIQMTDSKDYTIVKKKLARLHIDALKKLYLDNDLFNIFNEKHTLISSTKLWLLYGPMNVALDELLLFISNKYGSVPINAKSGKLVVKVFKKSLNDAYSHVGYGIKEVMRLEKNYVNYLKKIESDENRLNSHTNPSQEDVKKMGPNFKLDNNGLSKIKEFKQSTLDMNKRSMKKNTIRNLRQKHSKDKYKQPNGSDQDQKINSKNSDAEDNPELEESEVEMQSLYSDLSFDIDKFKQDNAVCIEKELNTISTNYAFINERFCLFKDYVLYKVRDKKYLADCLHEQFEKNGRFRKKMNSSNKCANDLLYRYTTSIEIYTEFEQYMALNSYIIETMNIDLIPQYHFIIDKEWLSWLFNLVECIDMETFGLMLQTTVLYANKTNNNCLFTDLNIFLRSNGFTFFIEKFNVYLNEKIQLLAKSADMDNNRLEQASLRVIQYYFNFIELMYKQVDFFSHNNEDVFNHVSKNLVQTFIDFFNNLVCAIKQSHITEEHSLILCRLLDIIYLVLQKLNLFETNNSIAKFLIHIDLFLQERLLYDVSTTCMYFTRIKAGFLKILIHLIIHNHDYVIDYISNGMSIEILIMDIQNLTKFIGYFKAKEQPTYGVDVDLFRALKYSLDILLIKKLSMFADFHSFVNKKQQVLDDLLFKLNADLKAYRKRATARYKKSILTDGTAYSQKINKSNVKFSKVYRSSYQLSVHVNKRVNKNAYVYKLFHDVFGSFLAYNTLPEMYKKLIFNYEYHNISNNHIVNQFVEYLQGCVLTFYHYDIVKGLIINYLQSVHLIHELRLYKLANTFETRINNIAIKQCKKKLDYYYLLPVELEKIKIDTLLEIPNLNTELAKKSKGAYYLNLSFVLEAYNRLQDRDFEVADTSAINNRKGYARISLGLLLASNVCIFLHKYLSIAFAIIGIIYNFILLIKYSIKSYKQGQVVNRRILTVKQIKRIFWLYSTIIVSIFAYITDFITGQNIFKVVALLLFFKTFKHIEKFFPIVVIFMLACLSLAFAFLMLINPPALADEVN